MARNRKRRGPDTPKVDDLFYDNPAADTHEDDATVGPAEGSTEERAGDELGAQSPGAPDEGLAEPEVPEHGTVEPGALESGALEPEMPEPRPQQDGNEHGYAARSDLGTSGLMGEEGAGRSRTRVGATGRWARAVVISGLAAGLVWGAGSSDLGSIDLAAALDRASTVPVNATQQVGLAVVTDSTIGCVGPGLVGLEDPSVAEPDQGVVVHAGSAPDEALPDGTASSGGGAITLVATPEGATGGAEARDQVATVSIDGSTWARGAADGSLAAGFAGTQMGYSFDEQQWGLATAACGAARDDLWLVAGGDEAGRVERLILANPTGNPVTVSAEMLGADGPVNVVGGSGIVVAPGGRQVVLLDALAPGEERPVVHVTTTGGPIVAALGDRWLEGTIDRGTEVTTATAAPATHLLIPGVPAPRPETADTATVRVAVPGAEAAVVQMRALTAEGPVRLEQGVSNIEPGAVVDVDVSDLPVGTQGIEVNADTPVVASAHVERRAVADGVSELAWIPAVTPTSGLMGAPLATSVDGAMKGALSVSSLEGARVEVVTVIEGTVETTERVVAAASSHTVNLPAGTESVWVRPLEGSASAAVVTTLEHGLGTQIAGLPLPEAPVTREVRAIAPWLP